MFSFIKQVFIVLLSFSSSLEQLANFWTKYVSSNEKAFMVGPTPIDLNYVELKYPIHG